MGSECHHRGEWPPAPNHFAMPKLYWRELVPCFIALCALALQLISILVTLILKESVVVQTALGGRVLRSVLDKFQIFLEKVASTFHIGYLCDYF